MRPESSSLKTLVTKVLIDEVVCELYSVELAMSRRYCYLKLRIVIEQCASGSQLFCV